MLSSKACLTTSINICVLGLFHLTTQPHNIFNTLVDIYFISCAVVIYIHTMPLSNISVLTHLSLPTLLWPVALSASTLCSSSIGSWPPSSRILSPAWSATPAGLLSLVVPFREEYPGHQRGWEPQISRYPKINPRSNFIRKKEAILNCLKSSWNQETKWRRFQLNYKQ